MKPKVAMYVYGDIITDARVNRAANALADNFDVTVISTDSGKEVKDDRFRNILLYNSGKGMKKLLKNIIDAFKVIKKEKPEIVYCHDYYSAILAYLLLKTKKCKKIIYDAHELIIPEPGLKDRRQNLFYWFEKHIIKKVNLVICASKKRGELMTKHYGLKCPPVPIRNISQLSISDDEQTDQILKSLEDFFSAKGPVVVYAGVVTKARKITELARAVSNLAPRFKLLIVGNGDAIEELKSITSSNEKLISAFTGSVPYRTLGAILSRCDIGFVYYPVSSLNNIYCASNKIYEYASVKLPMIANTNPTIQDELKLNHIGIASGNFEDALKELYNDLDEYKESCVNYTLNNPWQNDAALLLNKVLELC